MQPSTTTSSHSLLFGNTRETDTSKSRAAVSSADAKPFIPKPFSPGVPYVPRAAAPHYAQSRTSFPVTVPYTDPRKALKAKGMIRSPEQRKQFIQNKAQNRLSPVRPAPQRETTHILDTVESKKEETQQKKSRATRSMSALDSDARLGDLIETPVADINEDAVNPNDDLLVKPPPDKPVPTGMTRAELDHYDKTDRARMLRIACMHNGLAESLNYYYAKRPVPFRKDTKLRDYQVQALNWMALRESNPVHGIRGGILGPDMGLGKTIMSSSFVFWSERPVEGPTLIIASLNVLKEWRKHFAKFYDADAIASRVVYLHPELNPSTPKVTAKDLRNVDIVLSTYEMMRSSYRYLVKHYPDDANACIEYVNEETQKKIHAFHVRKPEDVRTTDVNVKGVNLIHQGIHWGRLMMDESQTISNPTKKGFRSAMAIAAPRRWGITGTIVRNYIFDIWAQLRAVGYNKVANKRSWTRNEAPRYYRIHQLSSVIYVLTYEQAGITLPPFTEETIRVTLTERERAVYEMIEAKARIVYLQAAQKKLSPAEVRVMITRLRQCAIAPALMNAHGALDDIAADFDDAIEGMFPSDDLHDGGEEEEEEEEEEDDDNDDADEEDDEDDDNNENNNMEVADSTSVSPIPPKSKKRSFDEAHLHVSSNQDGAKRMRDNSGAGVSVSSRESGDSEGDSDEHKAVPFKNTKEVFDFCTAVDGDGGISSSKMKAVLRAVEIHLARGPEHKIICFSMWSSVLSLLIKAMATHATLCDVQCVKVDGSVTGKDRDALLDTFRDDPSVRLLAIQGKVGGEGLNIQHATGGIAIEPHWTFQSKKQQRRRFWRVGQDKPTWWYDVIVDESIEQRVIEICEEKIKIEEEFKNKKRRARADDTQMDMFGKLLGVTPANNA